MEKTEFSPQNFLIF